MPILHDCRYIHRTVDEQTMPSQTSQTQNQTQNQSQTQNQTNPYIRDMLFSPCRVKVIPESTSMAKVPSIEASTQTATVAAVAGCAEDICAVCLELPGVKNVSITDCGHRFCTSCLLSSLRTKNTCPTCRAEIEPSRNAVIHPLTATVAAEIIQNEERDIDIARRISVINAFTDTNGRAGMIISLCRELAFGAAHSLAGWQGTSEETYHSSWREYEYNDYDSHSNDSESEVSDSESDSDTGDSAGPEPESQPERHDETTITSDTAASAADVENVEPELNRNNQPEVMHFNEPDIREVNDSVVYTSLAIRAAVTSATYFMVITLATVVVNVMSIIE